MLVRERFEKEYLDLFERYGFGTTIWSPLAGGILSGKYNDGTIPDGTRFATDPFASTYVWTRYFNDKKKDETKRILNGLADYAAELGYTQPQLAYAWAIASGNVSTEIMGFSKLEQIDENMKCLELYGKWNKEIEAKVEALLNNQHEEEWDYKKFTKRPMPRATAIEKKLL